MLGLVDYEGSDSEEESINEEKQNHVEAVVFPIPIKGVNVIDNFVLRTSFEEDKNVLNSHDDDFLTDSLPGLGYILGLDLLPSPSTVNTKSIPLVFDDELEDLVNVKQSKLERSRKEKKKEKKRKKELKRAKKRAREAEKPAVQEPKKKVKIDAFGALRRPDLESDNEDEKNVKDGSGSVENAGNKPKGLLSLLPKPANGTRVLKGTSIMLPSSLKPQKQSLSEKRVSFGGECSKICSTSLEHAGSDAEEDDKIDFFGLNTVEAVEESSTFTGVKVSGSEYGPGRPTQESQPSLYSTYAFEENIINEVGPSFSGAINDSEAAQLIYSHDVAPFGGTEVHASDAVSNIIDVNVDQALGPNIRANLLKNLHNKSLAEAAISHLSHLPKPKSAKDAVARRKHQITYLASVAVAREEQLAEQWSQNRHTKRMAAQKYGF